MMWSIDNVVDYLIQEIAFTGEKGITFTNLNYILADFAAKVLKTSAPVVPELVTENVKSVANDDLPTVFTNFSRELSPNLDANFSEKLWKWLLSHPSILKYQCRFKPDLARNSQERNTFLRDENDFNKIYYRLRCSDDCVWHTFTGHGVDYQKVQLLEFKLLCIIGGSKEKGIVQPDLIKFSGQDKRSVPKRTDKLQDYGYIVKRPIIWNGMRTSHCTLRRLTNTSIISSDDDLRYEKCHSLDMNRFLDNLFTILEEKRLVPLLELRMSLGSVGQRRETKFLAMTLRRLEIFNCTNRIMAEVLDKPTGTSKWMQCVKFIKPPSTDEYQSLFSMTRSEEHFLRAHLHDIEDKAFFEVEATRIEFLSHEVKTPKFEPSWNPYISLLNMIFDHVEITEGKGISSMELRDVIFGPFCKKPFDIIISKMTDNDRSNQPENVRYLSIVKDTSFLEKSSHYLYRTLKNFKLAVENCEAAAEVLELSETTLNRYGGPNVSGVASKVSISNRPKRRLEHPRNRKSTASVAEYTKYLKLSSRRQFQRKETQLGLVDEACKSFPVGKGCQVLEPSNSVKERSKGKKRGRPRKYPEGEEIYRKRMPALQKSATDKNRKLSKRNNTAQSKEKSLSWQREDIAFKPPNAFSPIHSRQSNVTGNTVAEKVTKRKRALENSKLKSKIPTKRVQGQIKNLTSLIIDGQCLSIPLAKTHSISNQGLVISPGPSINSLSLLGSDNEKSTHLTHLRPLFSLKRDCNRVNLTKCLIIVIRTKSLSRFEWFFSNGESIDKEFLANDSVLDHHTKDIVTTRRGGERSCDMESQIVTSQVDRRQKNAIKSTNRGAHCYGVPNRAGYGGKAKELGLGSGEDDNCSIVNFTQSSHSSKKNNFELSPKKQKISIGHGSIAHQRTNIVISIIRKCEGVFPGGPEINQPFSDLWKSLNGTTTDGRTVSRAIKDAVDSGKLRKIYFTFKDKDGILIKRSILTLIDITPQSTAVKMLQDCIVAKHPRFYRPPQVSASPSQSKAQLPPRHVYKKDFSTFVERHYRPKYLQKLEKNRSYLYARQFLRDTDGNISQQENPDLSNQTSYGFKGVTSTAPSPIHGGLRQLSRLPRLQLSEVRKSGVPVSSSMQDSKQSQRRSQQKANVANASKALSFYGLLQVSMKESHSSHCAVRVFQNLGMQHCCYWATTLTDPCQSFYRTTGTYSTDFSTIRLRKLIDEANDTGKLQLIFEEIMPQRIEDMLLSSRYHQSHVGEGISGDSAIFNHVTDEVHQWEVNNAVLLSADMTLRQPRYINYIMPASARSTFKQCQPNALSLVFMSSIFWYHNTSVVEENSSKSISRTRRPKFKKLLKSVGSVNTTSPLLEGVSQTPGTRDSNAMSSSSQLNPHLFSSHFINSTEGSKQQTKENQTLLEPSNLLMSTLNAPAAVKAYKRLHNLPVDSANLTGNKKKFMCGSANSKSYLSPSSDFSKFEEQICTQRLFIIVSVVKVLAGGIGREVNWTIVCNLCQELGRSMSSLPESQRMRLKKTIYLQSCCWEAPVQQAVLQILEFGEIPNFDFCSIVNSNWKNLINCVEKYVMTNNLRVQVSKPKQAVKCNFSIQLRCRTGFPQNINNPSTMRMIRETLLTKLSFGHDIETCAGRPYCVRGEASEVVCKSWVRANLLTSDANYNGLIAREKLEIFRKRTINKAVRHFVDTKQIKESSIRNPFLRSIEMTERFRSKFKNPIDASVLKDAITYKRYLDHQFSTSFISNASDEQPPFTNTGNGVHIDPASSSGAFLAITNLVAHDRVLLLSNPNPTSLHRHEVSLQVSETDADLFINALENESSDRPSMECRLSIYPNTTYVKGNPIRYLIEKLPDVPGVASGNIDGKIPLWIDFHGNFMEEWWNKFIACLLGHIALASGTSINSLTKKMGGVIEEWEIEIAINWLLELGSIKWIHTVPALNAVLFSDYIAKNGLMTSEWWWMTLENSM